MRTLSLCCPYYERVTVRPKVLTWAWHFFSSVHSHVRTDLSDPPPSCALQEWH